MNIYNFPSVRLKLLAHEDFNKNSPPDIEFIFILYISTYSHTFTQRSKRMRTIWVSTYNILYYALKQWI